MKKQKRESRALCAEIKPCGNIPRKFCVRWIRQNAGTNLKKRRHKEECTICHVLTFKVNKV